MTRRTPPFEDPPLPELDADSGPALPLSAAESDAVAWSVVSQFVRAAPGVEPTDAEAGPAPPLDAETAARIARQVVRRRAGRALPWRMAAAVALSCLFGGVAFAALRIFVLEPAKTQVATAAPVRPHFVPSKPQPAPTEPPAFLPEVAPAAAKPDVAAEPERSAKPSTARRSEAGREASADELLARANALRAKREWRNAEELYLRVVATRENPRTCNVALLSAAALAVQHTGAPRRGLSLYRRALANAAGGDLAEEAELGVADAYRALGEADHEAATLQLFIQHHPTSIASARARSRLAELVMR